MTHTIGFPGLGLEFEISRVAFTLFGKEIYWYGLIIVLGLILGTIIAVRNAKKIGLSADTVYDFLLWAIPLSVIGARIYYVIFNWDRYRNNLLSIINTREGGMAIYGGVIAAFLTAFVYAKVKKQNFFLMADTGVVGLALGQAIGRWGNFTNREVFGEYTDNLLAMRLPIAAVRAQDISESIAAHVTEGINYIQVHPTFLYESLWNLALMFLMLVYFRHRKFDGEGALLYLGGYGLGRAWIEGIRTDQLFIPGTELPVSQVLAVVLLIGSVISDGAVRIYLKKKKNK